MTNEKLAKDRELSLKFLMMTGLPPVKIRPKEKSAYSDWNPNKISPTINEEVRYELSIKPDMNLAALMSGRYVDLDIDNNNKTFMTALDLLLPRSNHEWGRESTPRSHRIYQLEGDFERAKYSKILKVMKGYAPMSVEVRGGSPKNGLYSVLPGSVHPSGEAYEWGKGTDPTMSCVMMPVNEFIKQIRLAQACAILAEHWVEGQRNDLSLAIAGMLWRIRTVSMATLGIDDDMDKPDDIMILSEAECLRVLEIVMQLAGDDPADMNSRVRNFKNTWEKLERDSSSPTTGGNTIKQAVGDIAMSCLYRLLSDANGNEELDHLTSKFFMWYGLGVVIDMDLVKAGVPQAWMSRDQASASLAGKKIILGEKKIPISNLMFSSSLLTRVNGLTFDPSSSEDIIETDTGLKVNTYVGFENVPEEGLVSDHDVEPFLDYLRNGIANRSDGAYKWLLNWLAHMVQFPWNKPGTALVLVGVQGSGKTFLGEGIMLPIIGKRHSMQTNSMSEITGNFNVRADNKILIQCNEALHSYQKDMASKLKSLITDESMRIEPKGINAFEKPNHVHYMFTSNEETAAIFIDPTPQERRFTVLQVSPSRATDVTYWREFREWVKLNLSKIHRYLRLHPVDAELARRPYCTEAKYTLQRMAFEPEISWITTRIQLGFPISEDSHQHWWDAYRIEQENVLRDSISTIDRTEWPNIICMNVLVEDLKKFMRSHGRVVYAGSLRTLINKVFPQERLKAVRQLKITTFDQKTGVKTIHRPRLYTFPSKGEIIDYLTHRYGEPIRLLLKDYAEDVEDVHEPIEEIKFEPTEF